MELTNEFTVTVPIDEAWAVLTDLERVAPCMPGCELQEVAGDQYRGVVKVKVGPIVARYRGVASFRERDEQSHRAVVRAEGRESRGQGSAAATVTATLVPEQGGTRITLHTDLALTGKVAQFGRGVLADVSSKLLRQFVQALEADVLAGAASAGAGATGTAAPAEAQGPRPAPSTSEPVDLVAAAGSSLARRIGPLLALALALGLGLWLLLRG